MSGVPDDDTAAVILHLSDLHLDGRTERAARLATVLAEADALPRIDAVVLTGDLADHGASAEYQQLLDAPWPAVPILAIPGNHDDRDAMRAATRDDDRFVPSLPGARLHGVPRVSGGLIVGLDSTVPGADHGVLDAASLDIVRDALAAPHDWALLAMHHPPVAVGHPLLDPDNLRDTHALRALLEDQPSIAACLTGHVHTALSSTFAGVAIRGAAGVVSTMRLGGRTGPVASMRTPPGFAVHTVRHDGAVTSIARCAEPAAA